MTTADLCVIGAGPSGLAAAAVAARAGLRVIVLDESSQPGGRLPGQLHPGSGRGSTGGWWRGAEVARQLTEEALAAGVQVHCRTAVWGLWPGFLVNTTGEGPPQIRASRVLVATGAAERAQPLPGWTLPGVISIGAAQVLVNVHRVRPGRRVLVVGIDPLSIAIAHNLVLAGVEVVGVVNPPPGIVAGSPCVPADNLVGLAAAARLAAPGLGVRLAGAVIGALDATPAAARLLAAAALRLLPDRTLRVWDIPVQFGSAALALAGDQQVRAALVAPVSPLGRIAADGVRRVPVDAVCLSGGLSPLVELAATAGCACAVIPELGGQVPLHGPGQETGVPGLYVAGSVAGVKGALAALAQGRIAGATIAAAAGALAPEESAMQIQAARSDLDRAWALSGAVTSRGLASGRALLAERWATLRASGQ